MTTLLPGLRKGAVVAPPSKSHAHRLLIANFLADGAVPADADGDSADILATKRCLRALAESTASPELDCGESGSTLRFLAPLAAALGKRPEWIRRGRLAARPFKSYEILESGVHELEGNVSSQFVTGLLFALPLLKGDSRIQFSSPLESRGYVEMTCDVIRKAGVVIHESADGFDVPGGQVYRPQPAHVEGDWSGAAFWFAMNALGSDISVSGLNDSSAQPDRAVVRVLQFLGRQTTASIDVSQFPDIFPVLTIVAAAERHATHFVGIRRLRLKECDRVAAMADVLARLGVSVEVAEDCFSVRQGCARFRGGAFASFCDHRIAMSIAVASTRADAPVFIDDTACAAKSYPSFFDEFLSMQAAQRGLSGNTGNMQQCSPL